MDDYLTKPFRKQDLSAKIESWLSRTPAATDTHITPREDPLITRTSELAEGLKQFEDDYGKEMALKIVGMFVPDAEARMARIERAVKQHDFRELEEAAHGLKSGCANVGAKQMAQLCAQLETCGEVKSLGNSEELLTKLRQNWATVRTEIATYRE
jgi:HPt (histidine-containing phosphotransfer) domain-containing protein